MNTTQRKSLPNIVKQDPGSQAEQLSNSWNKFHPTRYKAFISALYSVHAADLEVVLVGTQFARTTNSLIAAASIPTLLSFLTQLSFNGKSVQKCYLF